MRNQTQKIKNPKKSDPFIRLKYMGYCISQLPSNEISLDDMVKLAKFQLAIKTNRLLKDPIWDTYTKEEILIEFYAHQFNVSEKLRLEFEMVINSKAGEVNDFASWADSQMKDEKIVFNTLGESDEKIKFNPNDVIGDDL